MTISTDTERTFAAGTNSPWLVGNARLTDLSGQLLGAHVAHAGLIMFWAGTVTISEALRCIPGVSMAEQHFTLLPHLATLGWGVGSGGEIIDTYPYFVIGMLHLVASAVLGAGGLFHVFRSPRILYNSGGQAARFHYEWNDPKQLGLILGHHLIILGLGALLLVVKAMFFGGIYDTNLGEVRLITEPNLNPRDIFSYLLGMSHGNDWNILGMASVNNLEDVIGGHIWIAMILMMGGAWHILVPPFNWVRKLFPIEHGEEILAYSLLGLALMAFISTAFVYNSTVFPVEFYGEEPLTMANIQFFLGAIALCGYGWHFWRASRTISNS